MTTEEIIKGNKLIAEFMGFVKYYPNMTSESDLSNFYYYPHLDKIFDSGLYTSTIKMTSAEGYFINQSIRESHHLNDMQFDSSWGWLMPCIGKISNVCEEPEELDGLKYALLTNNIEEAWKFVVNYLTIS